MEVAQDRGSYSCLSAFTMCKCLTKFILNVIIWIAQIIKTAACVAIVLIVALRLSKIDYNSNSIDVTYTCLLGTNNGQSLCTYAYIGQW